MNDSPAVNQQGIVVMCMPDLIGIQVRKLILRHSRARNDHQSESHGKRKRNYASLHVESPFGHPCEGSVMSGGVRLSVVRVPVPSALVSGSPADDPP